MARWKWLELKASRSHRIEIVGGTPEDPFIPSYMHVEDSTDTSRLMLSVGFKGSIDSSALHGHMTPHLP
jgi:hypothetical protein